MNKASRIARPGSTQPTIVVVGGGFAGLSFIKRLKNKPVQLILIDKGNHHQFLPLLYQVATSGIEPDSIVFPFRKLFRNYNNIRYCMAEVRKINTPKKKVETSIGAIDYDYLVLATGSATNFFGNEDIAKKSLGLKSITDALDIRSHLLQNLEKATISSNDLEKFALSSVVVVGRGPAGVEMAGALAEFKKYVLPKDYPELEDTGMKVYLIEASPKILRDMPEKLSSKAMKYLTRLDVLVYTGTVVEDFDGQSVYLHDKRIIHSSAMVWTAGIKAELPEGINDSALNGQGRLLVNSVNGVTGLDTVFAIGDVAFMKTDKYPDGHPMVAQVAIQQGRNLAKNLLATSRGVHPKEFLYRDKGSMAQIGKKKAVATIFGVLISGFTAWLIWSFIHLMSILGIRNRFLICLNWFWSYLSYDKGDRVIIRKYQAQDN